MMGGSGPNRKKPFAFSSVRPESVYGACWCMLASGKIGQQQTLRAVVSYVRSRGQSGRTGDMALTSAFSHKRTFVGGLDAQNQAIGWLGKGRSYLGGGTVVRFR